MVCPLFSAGKKMMQNSSSKLSNQDIVGQIRDNIFSVLFYLYLWLGIDLRFIYTSSREVSNFPVFYRGWDFFEKFLSHPGGPVEYAAAFLSQLFCIGWAGALVVTALTWLIYVCTDSIIKTIKATSLRWVRFVPPILFLALYRLYLHHLVITVALLAALLMVCLYLKTAPKSKLYSLIYFIVLSVILHYIAGGAYLLFAVLCAIYELLFARRWQSGLLYLLLAAVIPYIDGVLFLGVSINETFSNLMPFSWKFIFFGFPPKLLTILYALYLFLPLTMLWWGLRGMFVKPGASEEDSSEAEKITEKKESDKRILSQVVDSRMLFVVILFAALFTYKNPLKAVFAVDYYAYEGNWPMVLSAARNCPDGDVAAHAANRALYHTGRLGYDMFRYPQGPDSLFLTAGRLILMHWLRFDTYIELGYINLAEHELIKSLDSNGERPMFLKRLALVNMVKGENGMARVFLGALSRTLFDAGWAKNYLEKMEQDPNLSTDKEIQYLRSMMPKKDRCGELSRTNVDMYLDLLDSNKHNQMAFEYLMAYYMLTKQPDEFAKTIGRLDDFDYKEIPRLYEEAVLLYRSTGKKIDLGKREISRESQERFNNFRNTYFGKYGKNKEAAISELTKNYSDSYLFYYVYDKSGMSK